MRIGLKWWVWVLGWVILPLWGMAQWVPEDSIPFSAFEGESRWAVYFPQEPNTVVLESHWAYQLGGDTVLLGAYNPSAPEALGLYVLVRDPSTKLVWKGIWKSERSVRDVPDFYTMRLQTGIRMGTELELLLEVESETPLGLYLILVEDVGSGKESFLPVRRWSDELTGWEAARGDLSWGVSFPDGVYEIWGADGRVEIAQKPFAKWSAHKKEFELFHSWNYKVEQVEGVDYTMAVLGYAVLGEHKTKNLGKIVDGIALQHGLAEVQVFRTDSAFTGHFLRYENPEVWEGVWKRGYLGEWRDGKWNPFVAEE